MLKLFNSTDKIYTSNGDKTIIPTKAKVHKEDNGSFYLELETGLEYSSWILPHKNKISEFTHFYLFQ